MSDEHPLTGLRRLAEHLQGKFDLFDLYVAENSLKVCGISWMELAFASAERKCVSFTVFPGYSDVTFRGMSQGAPMPEFMTVFPSAMVMQHDGKNSWLLSRVAVRRGEVILRADSPVRDIKKVPCRLMDIEGEPYGGARPLEITEAFIVFTDLKDEASLHLLVSAI